MSSTVSRPTAIVLLASIPLAAPLAGCREPPPPDPPGAEETALELAVDPRPGTGRRTAGDDVTELVRTQNAAGREPPLPTRRGRMARLGVHPAVRRTDRGFVARLPGATSVPSPAYHRGHVLAGGFGTYDVHAFEAGTGRVRWSARLSDDGPTDPACEDGICVFNTYSCTIFGVEAETGKHLWSWYLGSPQLATPVVFGRTVYTSYPDSSGPEDARFVLAAFDLATGKPSWRRWIDAEVNATPVAHGDRVVVATRAGTLYQFGAQDGAVLAVHRNRVASPPVLTEAGLYFARDVVGGANDMLVTASVLFPELETPKGTSRPPVRIRPRPLVAQHRLLTVEDGAVVATHRGTGRRLWQHDVDGDDAADIGSPLLHAGGDILLATRRGHVLRMAADSGEVTDRFELEVGPLSSQPIAVDGWLYAGTRDGTMVAFDTGQPDLTGWEMLGGGPMRQGAVDPEGT